MKFTTINSLLILSCAVTSVTYANDTQVKQVKAATEIKIDDIKRGPLADFYELVAQRPKTNNSISELAKEANPPKSTVNTSLAANDSSRDGRKTD
jgi:hypothetical protein